MTTMMMQVVSIKITFFISVVLLFTGCSEKKNKFILPNGEEIAVVSVNDFSENYAISYGDYEGFKGAFKDSLLTRFVLLFDNHSSKVGSDVLTDAQIEGLKEEKIVAIEFSLPESKISKDELQHYLLSKYPSSKWLEKEGGLYSVVSKGGENILCEIEYVNIAIPSFIIRILPY